MAKEIDLTLQAHERTELGKGAARRVRRDHRVPAVLHDHGRPPVHVTLPGHQLMLALRSSANSLLTIELPGSSRLALARQVQRHPVSRALEHVDLTVVRRGERVTVPVGIHVAGEPAPETLVVNELTELEVEVDATAIPERLTVDVTGRPAGSTVSAGEIELPAGATLVTDPDAQVLGVTAQQSAAALEAELESAEAEAGIEREEHTEEPGPQTPGDPAAGVAGAADGE